MFTAGIEDILTPKVGIYLLQLGFFLPLISEATPPSNDQNVVDCITNYMFYVYTVHMHFMNQIDLFDYVCWLMVLIYIPHVDLFL